jgi:hypothetical protein
MEMGYSNRLAFSLSYKAGNGVELMANKDPKLDRHFAVPGSEHKTITEIYAWVLTEPEGGEGIPAIPAITLGGSIMPLVGADRARIESLRQFALNVRRTTGCPVRLVRFGSRTVLEELP